MTQAPKVRTGWRWHRWVVLAVCMVALGSTAGWLQGRVGRGADPAGFVEGLWQGALMPCGLPVLALGHDLEIYAARNTGRPYKLGYTLGVNACGLVFFGVFFARLARLRRRAAVEDRTAKKPE